MNARIREKQAAYLAAMGRTPPEDERGPNVVDLPAPVYTEADEVVITYDKPRRVTRVRGKTTRRIVADICRELGRAPAQVIATATKQGDFYSAWIKANDGPDVGDAGGVRLAFVTGLTPTVINIVLGHPVQRVEPIPGEQRNFVRFVPIGSNQAMAARLGANGEMSASAETPAATDDEAPDEFEAFREPEPFEGDE